MRLFDHNKSITILSRLSIYSKTVNTCFHQMQSQEIHTSWESQVHVVYYLLTFLNSRLHVVFSMLSEVNFPPSRPLKSTWRHTKSSQITVGLEMGRSSANAEVLPKNWAECSTRFGSATCDYLVEVQPNFCKNLCHLCLCIYGVFALAADIN